MRADRSAIGWGIGLVTFGGGLLLRNVGVWPARMSVWPVALIAAGAALLVLERERPGRAEIAIPLALLIVGGAFFLRDLRIVPTVQIVPLALIAIGIALLVNAARRPRDVVSALQIPLEGVEALRLEVHHGGGRLTIRGREMDELLLDGDFGGGVEHTLRRQAGRAEVVLKSPPRRSDNVLRNWTIAVNATVLTSLELKTGATKTVVDMRDMRVERCAVKTGASETEIIAPSSGRSKISVEAGAASVTVRVPDGVAAEVVNRSALGGVDIDDVRFPRDGDVHRSAGYDEAADRVRIELDGGLASFTVR